MAVASLESLSTTITASISGSASSEATHSAMKSLAFHVTTTAWIFIGSV